MGRTLTFHVAELNVIPIITQASPVVIPESDLGSPETNNNKIDPGLILEPDSPSQPQYPTLGLGVAEEYWGTVLPPGPPTESGLSLPESLSKAS